jgi:8-oxo-dGTP pyrophosphatase MutT (NUDIX family)
VNPPDWKLVRESPAQDHHIFKLRTLTVADPRNGREYSRVVIEAPDWVNVIAVTEDDQVVLIRQFRFGTWRNELEIPGGMLDPGEDAATAATRELEEETGFKPREVRLLGVSRPNPAFIDNRLHSYLALGCKQVHEGRQESSEDIRVELVPRAKIPEFIRSGEIVHSLVLVAFLLERMTSEV